MNEAMIEADRALEFDPLSLIMRALRGLALYFSLQYDEAVNQCKSIFAMDQNFAPAHLFLGMIYTTNSMYDEAISEFQCAIGLFGRSSLMLGALGHAYAAHGKLEEAHKLLNELTQISEPMCVPSYYIAAMYADLGKNHEAFEWLTRALKEHDAWLVFLKVDPIWQTLRPDPRFREILRKMGLEP
jgi:tetratricopeptide (TPR) repeat protein